ncbi:MAG: integrase, partial [Pseudonocardiales bacterium]|nr:integrase [Pseudonocardiales bacterium]
MRRRLRASAWWTTSGNVGTSRTRATIDELLARYVAQFDGAPNTLTAYRSYLRNHISPLLGQVKVGDLDADILDSFYAELRRCRRHCGGGLFIEHRTDGAAGISGDRAGWLYRSNGGPGST